MPLRFDTQQNSLEFDAWLLVFVNQMRYQRHYQAPYHIIMNDPWFLVGQYFAHLNYVRHCVDYNWFIILNACMISQCYLQLSEQYLPFVRGTMVESNQSYLPVNIPSNLSAARTTAVATMSFYYIQCWCRADLFRIMRPA